MTDGQFPPSGQYSGQPHHAPPGPPVPAVPPPGGGETNKRVIIIVAVAAALVVAMVAVVGIVLVSRDSGSAPNQAESTAAVSSSLDSSEYGDIPADYLLHGSIRNKLAACSAASVSASLITPRKPPYDFTSPEMLALNKKADFEMARLASRVSPEVEEPFRSTLQSFISAYYKVNRAFDSKNSSEMEFWSGQTDLLAGYINRQCGAA